MNNKLQLSLLIIILGTITVHGTRPESQKRGGTHVLTKHGECSFTCFYDDHMLLGNFVFNNCGLDMKMRIKCFAGVSLQYRRSSGF